MHQNSNSYLNFLSALSLQQLTSVTTSLQCATSHPNSVQVQAILHDFFEQGSASWEIIRNSSSPCAVSVSRFFLNRYQNSVFHTLCDLRTSNRFCTADSCLDLHPSPHTMSSDMWLYQSLDHMDSRLHCAQKDEILSSLHSIPSHLRPQYSNRPLRACHTPLLLHIRSRISYLGSRSHHSFLLFSIFPFHDNASLSMEILSS